MTLWHRKVSMNCFPISIPYLVVSSKQTLEETIELHVLTPFGNVDISFSVVPLLGQGRPHLDVRVEGDMAPWLLEYTLPPAFRKTIVEFVGRLALRHSRCSMDTPCELRILFPKESGDIHLTGQITPYASAIAGG